MRIETTGGARFSFKDDGTDMPPLCCGEDGRHIYFMRATDCRELAAFLVTAAERLEKYGRLTEPEPVIALRGGSYFVSRGTERFTVLGDWVEDCGVGDSVFYRFPSRWLAQAALDKVGA